MNSLFFIKRICVPEARKPSFPNRISSNSGAQNAIFPEKSRKSGKVLPETSSPQTAPRTRQLFWLFSLFPITLQNHWFFSNFLCLSSVRHSLLFFPSPSHLGAYLGAYRLIELWGIYAINGFADCRIATT
jgi:hypothetical protein